jgi:hypothetical protein
MLVTSLARSAVHLEFGSGSFVGKVEVCWRVGYFFMSRLLRILPSRYSYPYTHTHTSAASTMKFSNAVLTCLVLATPAGAWSTRSTSSTSFRRVAAVQLHASASASSISTESAGEVATESFRLQFKEGDKTLSPWHDIALKNADGSYNMVSLI